ncbi:UDP-2,4-diacetamido-2,4,6-trideoxy-beta-L-altropyranose hydrolase [Scandinavium goeteborgense]|uniref:UDP-2,4-diacetamido-2,4, 6-trideoxy-beta-L-altropyranose hydrolase n=1 Tax=Scandinavium goeteborgense TaxID=1851514 RepID=A0A4R6EDT9_SCAGO|nr:UDP-2,4-diacetamido-2,4,6-trideoxy-beta-L-altropyranose hydrolase [Scandinavium goeteborgense]TDN55629.1 UDP-2,4-diacetamido-2,4,6-trideoxy-beta-L-altropyranose hydrolase [Scandinavium goeteborgense]
MKVAIRVDASLSIGTGHVMRCLNLANALKDKGYRCVFITKRHPGNLIEEIKSSNFDAFVLDTQTVQSRTYLRNETDWLDGSQEDDATQAIELCHLNEFIPDIIIVDHYAIDCRWEDTFKYGCPKVKLITIDDLCNRNHSCDMLIDSTLERQQIDYKDLVPDNCQYLLGTQYALLKHEFELLRCKAVNKRSKAISSPMKVLITMGGVDMDNITSKVLSSLEQVSSEDIDVITVILGSNCPNINSIKEHIKCSKHKIDIQINIKNMPEVMLDHDAAIGALGSTTWERATLGLPTINIAIASNQLVVVDKLKKHGFIVFESPSYSAETFLSSWEELKSHYSEFVIRSFNLCDGGGLNRVVEAITKLHS